jgi:hypothetical protein
VFLSEIKIFFFFRYIFSFNVYFQKVEFLLSTPSWLKHPTDTLAELEDSWIFSHPCCSGNHWLGCQHALFRDGFPWTTRFRWFPWTARIRWFPWIARFRWFPWIASIRWLSRIARFRWFPWTASIRWFLHLLCFQDRVQGVFSFKAITNTLTFKISDCNFSSSCTSPPTCLCQLSLFLSANDDFSSREAREREREKERERKRETERERHTQRKRERKR